MKTTLLVMAAGIGSRYGVGIKQLIPVGMNDELIIDFSVHDAIEAGFNKIIFVIRKDIEADFRARIGIRVEALGQRLGVEVLYAFQNSEEIPDGFRVPDGRRKPWGTGQAVLAAKELIHEPFMVINADDYYGKKCYQLMHDWLVQPHSSNSISMAGFILKNTLSDNGGVTRGICKMAADGIHAADVVETHNIIKTADGAEVNGVALNPDAYVSMNMWGFPAQQGQSPEFLSILQRGFRSFFEKEVPANPLKAEYLLPTLIGSLLRENQCTVTVFPTDDTWFGVTYQEDHALVVARFRELIEAGVYGPSLYADI